MAPTDLPQPDRKLVPHVRVPFLGANVGSRRFWFRLASAILLALLLYAGIVTLAVINHAKMDETRPADAIVVFGAAEYAGKPSPIYRARLEHAFNLFQRGVAPVVIVTGGAGNDPVFTEGGVGHDYLLARGIPERQLIAETQGEDTKQSAQRVANIMRANNMKSCVAVSDGYHLYRIKGMLGSEGVTVYGAPRPEVRPASVTKRASAISREVLSYTIWKLHLD
jgi:uncharacterized SAM-binding protein YcdF (DUF218 family)